jgi:hypothetical protein
MTTDAHPKYAVLKWDDWENLKKVTAKAIPGLDAWRVQDAEVIRQQDLTAAPLFYAYASIIHSFADLASQTGTPTQYESLREVADHFMGAAETSEALGEHRKLPD